MADIVGKVNASVTTVARINTPVRTVIADPKFKGLPTIKLGQLTDVYESPGIADGDVLAYDAVNDRFIFARSALNISILNGGTF